MLRLPFEWRMATGDAWMWKTDRTLENPPLNEEDWSSRLLFCPWMWRVGESAYSVLPEALVTEC